MSATFNGALRREAGEYYWSDGTHEPRVRSMRLKDLAPNFRCTTQHGETLVEIPKDWQQPKHWPDGHVDDDTRQAIAALVAGRQLDMIYAEGTAEALRDHRLQRPGWLVPINEWDVALAVICGVWWDKADEADILAKARSLGQGD